MIWLPICFSVLFLLVAVFIQEPMRHDRDYERALRNVIKYLVSIILIQAGWLIYALAAS